MKIIAVSGNKKEIGFDLGKKLNEEIRHNVSRIKRDIRVTSIGAEGLSRISREYAAIARKSSLEMMEGLSRGSGVPFKDILTFNALQDIIFPEGCTTFAAVGSATSDGKAVVLKNRDIYYKGGLANIFLVQKTSHGNVLGGVTLPGSTGFVMGLNRYGVAVSSNAGPTDDLVFRGKAQLSRGEVIKEGLEYPSAKEAVKHALGRLTDSRMKIPGILFFVDSKDIYIVEAHKSFAVVHITDGFAVRANRFLVLENPDSGNERTISSICRYARGSQLLKENSGKINREKFMDFSMDHKNGPGVNSICRHSSDPEEAVTVSASVMEIDSENPGRSRISVALGTPCWAWRQKKGNHTFQMEDDPGSIPASFTDGSVFNDFFKPDKANDWAR